MTLRTMQQRAPHLFAPQFSVDAENILKKVAKKFAGNKKDRIFAAQFRNDQLDCGGKCLKRTVL